MKHTQHHETIRRLDEDGKLVVGVLLANACTTAWLYAEDYEAITAKYGLCSWMLLSAGEGKPSYVRFKHQGKQISVARLILNAPPRTAVKFKDCEPRNLRSSNLWLDHGGGGVTKKPKTRKKPRYQPFVSSLRIPVGSSHE